MTTFTSITTTITIAAMFALGLLGPDVAAAQQSDPQPRGSAHDAAAAAGQEPQAGQGKHDRQQGAGETGTEKRRGDGQARAGAAKGPALVVTTISVPVFETTAGSIAASPTAFYGGIVAVKAEVEEVLGPRSFTLDEDRVGAGPDVLVIAPRPASEVPEDEEVTVIGHVRPFVTAALESDYEWFDADFGRETEIELRERPVIVAASILTGDGRELLAAPLDAEVRAPAAKAAATAGDAAAEAAKGADGAVVAEIAPTKGNDVEGTVTFAPAPEGVRVTARLTGLDPGPHGIHVHERGDCSAPDASSAGEHFNPTNARHGGRDETPSHVGDMGNIVADAEGKATLEYVDKQMTLDGEKSIVGKAVIVHASADDLNTQPAGASGDRIGCGVIEPPV